MSKFVAGRDNFWLVGAIKHGLFACLFMPLIVGGDFIFPFIFPKQLFFQVVIEIIFALYLYLIFVDPRYRPRSSWLWLAIVIYFLAMVLSAIFGVNAYHSFWSNYERMAGVISLTHYLGFLFLAANMFETKKEWYGFFDVSVVACFMEALYGLGQAAGKIVSSGGARLDGTIGNASFLAGYMLLNAFFALWLVLKKHSFPWRVFYGLAIAVNLFMMYKTQTRGAVLAFLAGIGVLFVFVVFARQKYLAQLPFKSIKNLKIWAVSVFFVFCFLGGLIWLNRDSSFVRSSPTLHRVTHISASETTAQTRLLAWRMSVRGFWDRPILGWGPENYYVIFNKFYNPHLYPVESWFDRSHNAYLDILSQTGLAGAISYLAAAVLAFGALRRAFTRGKIDYFEAAIFTVILIVYGIQNIFLFDTQVTLLMISLILSFAVFLSFETEAVDARSKTFRPNFLFVALIGLLTWSFFYYFNLKPALAGKAGIDAIETLQYGQILESKNQTAEAEKKIAEAAQKFRDSYNLKTFGVAEVANRAQDAVLQMTRRAPSGELNSAEKELIGAAIDGLKKSLELEPLNVRLMMMLSALYQAAAWWDDSYLAQADLLLQRSLELSPTRQEVYSALGRLRLYQGRNDEALLLMKKAVDLNEGAAISHWNFGLIAIAVGQKEPGQAAIKKAVELGHSYQSEDFQQLIGIYTRQSDWPEIIDLYRRWIDLTKVSDARPYAGLAGAYAKTGDKRQAKEWAEKAAQIDPSFRSEAEKFIEELGK